MDSRSFAALALVAVIVAPAMPAQAAFHGVGWTASGVATKGTASYLIEVTWGGFYSSHARNVFTVAITDPVTGAVVAKDDFLGTESLNGPPSYCCWELLFMTGTSYDPSVQFTVSGTQFAFTSSQMLFQVLQGTYDGYSFTVNTADEHYCFC